MAAGSASATPTLTALGAVWKAATPTRQGFAAVVSEVQSMQMVGEGSLFESGAHVPVTHMAFFKAPAMAFLSELKAKVRRSAKSGNMLMRRAYGLSWAKPRWPWLVKE
jgi:hypothetical protein